MPDVLNKKLFWWLLLAALAGYYLLELLDARLNHDVGWFLYGAQRLLNGAAFYRDFFDLHPPAMFYLLIPPAAIAASTGISAISLLYLYLFAIITLSLVLVSRILNAIMAQSPVYMRGFLLLLVLTAILVFPVRAFGHREHFAAILMIPYILQSHAVGSAFGTGERWIRLLIGAMAGVAIAVKPLFALSLLGLEVYFHYAFRPTWETWRTETLAAVTVAGAYCLSVIILHFDYVLELPTLLGMQSMYNAGLGEVLLRPSVFIYAAALLLHILARKVPVGSRLRDVTLVAATAFFAIAVLQLKDWSHHFLPSNVFSVLSIALSLLALTEYVLFIRVRLTSATVLATAFLILWTVIASGWMLRSNEVFDRLAGVVEGNARDRSIVVFSTSVFPAFPLVNHTGVGWSLRYNALWFLPYFVQDNPGLDDPSAAVQEAQYMESVLSDLERNEPALVIVDESETHDGIQGVEFNLLSYYSRHERFREFFRHYHRLVEVQSYSVYLYDRVTDGTEPIDDTR